MLGVDGGQATHFQRAKSGLSKRHWLPENPTATKGTQIITGICTTAFYFWYRIYLNIFYKIIYEKREKEKEQKFYLLIFISPI